MAVTPADIALGVFTACNTARVLAYLPQILKISRDTHGATAISYTTWALFGVSHFSTVVYAILALQDWRMAAIFGANTLCCLIILGLTAWKRAVFRADQRKQGPAGPLTGRNGLAAAPLGPRELATNLAIQPVLSQTVLQHRELKRVKGAIVHAALKGHIAPESR